MTSAELEAAAKLVLANKTKYGYAESKIYVDGQPFSFENHNYLIGLYQDHHRNIVIEKSAQMGASVYALTTAFFVCDSMNKNVIYFFPTDTDVQDFSKTRANPMIEDSPYLRSVTSQKDSLGLRRVGNSWLYFRGMKSSIAMKCHDSATEVLTRDGWKLFKDASTSDTFATRAPDGKFMWQRASEVYSYDYEGPMCHFLQDDMDALVTPHHRMLVRSRSGNDSFRFAEDVELGYTTPRTIDMSVSVLPLPKMTSYVGKVYCATVPNGTLLTRRNGYTIWSGNSIPADYLIMDELDEVSEASESLADQRLNHSMLKWRLKLSTPTFEGYGIDREFKLSDMRYWNLVCRKCKTRNIVEKTFPDCVRQVSESEAYLICDKCKSVLDSQYGVWVADNPSVERIHGYHISGLYSHFLDLSDLMAEYNGGRKRAEFFRSKLGLPYTAADQRITIGMVRQCIDNYEMHFDRHTYMGVDQKGDELHIVIRKPNKMTGKHDIIFIGRVREFGQLDMFMKQYDVDVCVIDGTPNQHSARDFASRFGGRVFLCYYQETMRGDYTWVEPKSGDSGVHWEVKVNRTEALDAMYEQLMRREISLPKETDEVGEFVVQLTQLAKVYEEDDDGAILRAVWKRLGPEHYAHANSYSLIAQSRFEEVTNKSAITVKPKSMLARMNYSRRYEMGSRY